MNAILTTFGIDWHLLVINIINFAVLMAGLWYFLYGPVMKMLEDRRKKVAEGVAAADKAQKALMDIEGSRNETLSAAAREADELLAKARTFAQTKGKEMREQAQATAESLLKGAELEAQEIKHQAIAESKEEVAKLIVLGMEKMLANK